MTVPAERIPVFTLGDRLRKSREFAGLKQTELARDIGIGRASIVNYEADKYVPSRPVLLSWALRCGISLDWLITGQDERTHQVRAGQDGRSIKITNSALTSADDIFHAPYSRDYLANLALKVYPDQWRIESFAAQEYPCVA